MFYQKIAFTCRLEFSSTMEIFLDEKEKYKNIFGSEKFDILEIKDKINSEENMMCDINYDILMFIWMSMK